MGLLRKVIDALKTKEKKVIAPSSSQVPYVDGARKTKTGRIRAIGADKKRGWFGVDKSIDEVVGLSENAKAVYKYLSRVADKDGYCFPFYKTIAQRCSLAESSVAKALKQLESKGLLVRLRRVSRRGGSSNLFQLRKVGQ